MTPKLIPLRVDLRMVSDSRPPLTQQMKFESQSGVQGPPHPLVSLYFGSFLLTVLFTAVNTGFIAVPRNGRPHIQSTVHCVPFDPRRLAPLLLTPLKGSALCSLLFETFLGLTSLLLLLPSLSFLEFLFCF